MKTMQILISTLERCSTDGFVEVCHWRTQKSSADGKFTASQYGTESWSHEEGATFEPYENLTEAGVVNWLKERWGTDGLAAKEAALDAQLQQMQNPPVLPGVPWAAPVSAPAAPI